MKNSSQLKTLLTVVAAVILVAGGLALTGNNEEDRINGDSEKTTVHYNKGRDV